MSEQAESLQRRIVELEAQLADARARIPKHSTPPALIAQIDELEEELARLHTLERWPQAGTPGSTQADPSTE